MKKLLYILVSAATASGLLSSCADKLDLKPISQTTVGDGGQGTAGSFIKDRATAEAAIAACYAYFKNGGAEYYVLDYFNIGDAQSDNAYAGADNADGFQIDEFKIQSTNVWVGRDWGYLYAHISNANAVIINVPKVTDPNLSQTRKNQIVAEAKFIRARAYFDLVRLFGDVPLVIEELPTITSDNLAQIYPLLYPSRKPVADVYAQIIKDLEEAGPDAPATAANKGFATQGAIYTLLSKVYATQQPANWNKVKENTDKVMALGYDLLPVYEQLWDGAHENSVESIFEINFDSWETGGNWGTNMFNGNDWKKFCNPSNDMIKAYDDEKDVVRKASTLRFENVTGKWSDKYLPVANFPFFTKMRKTDGTQNIIIYRLSDVLLLRAEALNELGDLGGARTLVDRVRNRVNLTGTTAADQASMRLAIEKERRLELAFEGQRWYDLLRTNRAITVMQAVKDGNGNSLGYQLNENKLKWPIPQGEKDKNANLTQNPGY